MDNLLFSIVVPVYNASQYLKDCVESVLIQESNNYELILVNDGSTDNSAAICDAFAEKNEAIKVFHKENEGPIPTRLFGIQHAKGEYVIHLDSDDYLEKDTLQYLESTFKQYQCDCIIYGLRFFTHDETLEIYTVNEDSLISDKHEIWLRIFSSNAYNSLCRKAYRRDIVDYGDLSNLLHIRKGEDLILSLGVLKCCRSFFFSKKILYNYRKNDDSIIHKNVPLPKNIPFTLSGFVLDFIRKEAEFSEKEMDNYRKTRYRESFVPLIIKIATADNAIKEKLQLFRNIRGTNYYKEFLGRRIIHSYNNIVELIILVLFRYGFDRILIAMFQTAGNVKKRREHIS